VGKHKYIIVCRAVSADGYNNPLLIVKLKCPAKWNDAGKAEVLEDLIGNIEGWFDLTQYDTIYGLSGIGLHWMVCKMEKVRAARIRSAVTSHTMISGP
jgi:hypothetical protein